MDKLASIIVRTKDEEERIRCCLDALFTQDYKNIEIIIVDTGSSDSTLSIVASYKEVKILHYNDRYLPGRALNYGCSAASGEYLVFISAHCVPVNNEWLSNLILPLKSPEVAGVYGKQEPTDDSDPFDKRDLILTFGLDRKVQWSEPFFHNANSALKKELWDKIPFDNDVTNIEDRVWAANMQHLGYCICYEPSARVFHHHGIHQTGSKIRCEGVNNVMNNIGQYILQEKAANTPVKAVIGVIPFSEKITGNLSFKNIALLFSLLTKDFLSSGCFDKVVLLTDCAALKEYAEKEYPTITVPYLRQQDADLSLLGVLEEFVERAAIDEDDMIILTEIVFHANNRGHYFASMVTDIKKNNALSSAWIEKNRNPLYRKYDDKMIRIDEEGYRFRGKHSHSYEVKKALGIASRVRLIKKGQLLDVAPYFLEDIEDSKIIKVTSDKDLDKIYLLFKDIFG